MAQKVIKTIMYIRFGEKPKDYLFYFGTEGFSLTKPDNDRFTREFVKLIDKYSGKLVPAGSEK